MIKRFDKKQFGISGTMGHKALDRIFGIEPLTARRSDHPLDRSDFVNKNIPYDKDREPPGDMAQEMAVQMGMNNTEVEFIEGPAATGKTTAIEEIIRQAVKQGKKVLLVSHDHQAVDNMIEGLANDPEVPLLRVGNDPVHIKYLRCWPGNKDVRTKPEKELTTKEKELKRTAEEAALTFQSRCVPGRGVVFAGTNMGVSTDWYMNVKAKARDFDIVIMDEASRDTLSGALVPLQYLKQDGKAIFVGDTKQLPPFRLTRDEEEDLRVIAAGSGKDIADVLEKYNESIFEYLIGRGYGDRVMLSTNYRSHPLIAWLVSELFYDGDVHPRGWEDFDADTLSLNIIDIAKEAQGNMNLERLKDKSFYNPVSAKEVLALVKKFHEEKGMMLKDITVITPYSAQRDLIRDMIKAAYPGFPVADVQVPDDKDRRPEVVTIDSYQGAENRAIIFDFVRSNSTKSTKFATNLRRLNVGLSRPKDNLAIVWDSRTVTGEPGPYDDEDDRKARQVLQKINVFYQENVLPFIEEEAPGLKVPAKVETPSSRMDQEITGNGVLVGPGA